MAMVPEVRISAVNDAPVRSVGRWVLYWMIAQRRTRSNAALQRAVEWSRRLGRPLVVLEALRVGYPWASDRLHRFALEGMRDNEARCREAGVRYHPYVEPDEGAGRGLLAALASEASVVVTDDFPAFFLPRMVAAAGRALEVRLEKVDSNGLFPMRATDRVFTTAFSFRAFLQKNLAEHLLVTPDADPLRGYDQGHATLPDAVLKRWPRASAALLDASPAALAQLPIDHSVQPGAVTGGAVAAEKVLQSFVDDRLARYGEERSHPDSDASSGLSPWLHWGHLSVHDVLRAIAAREDWSVEVLASKGGGKRTGWWRMSPESEAFLDELVTWREIGFNMAALRDDAESFDSLPPWALRTLADHAKDKRPHLYSAEELESARTGDPLWNAAQTELVRDGRLHNYMRMLWGKKVLEWSRTPREAFDLLVHLNNKYALDGRDPNSWSGIAWVFGRYDRAWGPERNIFGTVRYMSSENTARKLRLKAYLARNAPAQRPAQTALF